MIGQENKSLIIQAELIQGHASNIRLFIAQGLFLCVSKQWRYMYVCSCTLTAGKQTDLKKDPMLFDLILSDFHLKGPASKSKNY